MDVSSMAAAMELVGSAPKATHKAMQTLEGQQRPNHVDSDQNTPATGTVSLLAVPNPNTKPRWSNLSIPPPRQGHCASSAIRWRAC